MEFIMKNLEMIAGVVGGISIAGIMFISKSKGGENDLTQIYVKYKKHSDNINKSAKTIF